MKTFCFILLLICGWMLTGRIHPSTHASDRVTLFHGDIFIGDELEFREGRYLHERFGFKTRLPYWFVKKIEKDETVFETTSQRVGAVSLDELLVFDGKIISVTSAEPMETSHLELHPWRSDYWITAERYIRGYIVNRTQVGYEVLRASMVFYQSQPSGIPNQAPKLVRLMEAPIVVHKMFPMTMKPFLVDARDVPWDKVDTIWVQQTGETPMIR